MKHEGGSDTNCSWSSWSSPQRPGKDNVGTGDQRKNQDPPDHSTVKNQLEGLEESWRSEETWCLLNFNEKPPVKTGMKKLQWVEYNNNGENPSISTFPGQKEEITLEMTLKWLHGRNLKRET